VGQKITGSITEGRVQEKRKTERAEAPATAKCGGGKKLTLDGGKLTMKKKYLQLDWRWGRIKVWGGGVVKIANHGGGEKGERGKNGKKNKKKNRKDWGMVGLKNWE